MTHFGNNFGEKKNLNIASDFPKLALVFILFYFIF